MASNQIWVDKYRPKNFDEIIGQDFFIKRIKSFLKSKSLPHLLFSGSPGTGKTTTALVVAKDLYGEDGIKGNFLELNASDDRGIDVIRNQIKEFAKLKSLAEIPYKIICLDEADSLTKEAQQALRRTMEKYSNSCRFILACNEISKILDPIQSRCVIFKFKALDNESLKKLLSRVAENENLKIDEKTQDYLIKVSRGDTRKLLNTMQATTSISKKFNIELINEILDFVNPDEIKEMIDYAQKANFNKARDLMVKLKTTKGLTALEILKEVYKQIIDSDIESNKKIKIVDRIATIEFRIVEGSDEELQLEGLLAMIALIK